MKNVYIAMLWCAFASIAQASPYIEVEHTINGRGYATAKVHNKTNKQLSCHIAIDGYKIRFKLMPNQSSRNFTATDKRFNHTHFSVKCEVA